MRIFSRTKSHIEQGSSVCNDKSEKMFIQDSRNLSHLVKWVFTKQNLFCNAPLEFLNTYIIINMYQHSNNLEGITNLLTTEILKPETLLEHQI